MVQDNSCGSSSVYAFRSIHSASHWTEPNHETHLAVKEAGKCVFDIEPAKNPGEQREEL